MAKIYISLGSNIEPEKYLALGLTDLQSEFGPLILSSVFESEAVGFSGSNFLNMVVSAETALPISEVNQIFKQIEAKNGRITNAKKFSPRTLDLDLLLYGECVSQHPIELPRAEIITNAFVLWPLSEIAPEEVHPQTQQSYSDMWQQYDKNKQKLWPITFEWQAGTD